MTSGKPGSGSSASICAGAVRFAAVSLLAYGIWAFGGRMTTAVLYSAIALAFIALSGALMFPLMQGSNRLARFYAAFVPAFLLYAVFWCLGWFGIGGQAGEIFGSAAGLAAFALVFKLFLKSREPLLPVFAVLFLFHTLGYTLGGVCYYAAHGKGMLAPLLESRIIAGRLLWGLFYGMGFGGGIGYALFRFQSGDCAR